MNQVLHQVLAKGIFGRQTPDKILFHTGKLFIPNQKSNGNPTAISISEILYLQASGAYCDIFLVNSSKINVSKNLRIVTDKLPKSWFIRVHKKFTINKELISEVQKNPPIVTLSSKIELPIGETFLKPFMMWFNSRKL